MLDKSKLRRDTYRTGTYVWGYEVSISGHFILKLTPPTKLYLRNNKGNTKYLSNYMQYISIHHLVKVGKNDKHLKSQVIPWDRDIKCFMKKEECIVMFDKAIAEAIADIEAHKIKTIASINRSIQILKYNNINNLK